jgi:LacI family transcriptional regulator
VPEMRGPWYSELLMGYESAAARQGQSVVLVVTGRRTDPTEAVRDLAGRVDGLVLSHSTISDPAAQSVGKGTPVVLLSRPQVPGCDAVAAENAESARELTAHLMGHGRRHLVFVGDPDASPEVAERYRGFRLAHAAADIPVRRPPLRVPLLEAAGVQVAEEILRRRVRVDGLVCANDELALAVMKRLQDNGVHVPEDLAVVGWDDRMAARYVSPGLTTVRPPMRELGRLAAVRLHERITGQPVRPDPLVLPAELVLRSSCGCPALQPRSTVRASPPPRGTPPRGGRPR